MFDTKKPEAVKVVPEVEAQKQPCFDCPFRISTSQSVKVARKIRWEQGEREKSNHICHNTVYKDTPTKYCAGQLVMRGEIKSNIECVKSVDELFELRGLDNETEKYNDFLDFARKQTEDYR
jgi:hypothetical protein